MIIHSDIDPEEKFDDSNMCLICYDTYDEKSKVNDKHKCVTLKCNHKFHYECIYITYKSQKKPRVCPYCRKDGGYLPLIPGQIPQRFIHKEYTKLNNDKPLKISKLPRYLFPVLTSVFIALLFSSTIKT